MTHKRGTLAISVVRYVVTPSIRLEGTKASRTQNKRRDHATGATSIERRVSANDGTLRRLKAHAANNTRKAPYKLLHKALCCVSRKAGSSTSGYASSAIRLPRLLAP